MIIVDTMEWARIGAWAIILDWLSNGFPITFKQSQPEFHQGNRPMTKESREFITAHIQELLLQGAIEKTQTPPYCTSPIATLPKNFFVEN